MPFSPVLLSLPPVRPPAVGDTSPLHRPRLVDAKPLCSEGAMSEMAIFRKQLYCSRVAWAGCAAVGFWLGTILVLGIHQQCVLCDYNPSLDGRDRNSDGAAACR